ncbi:hypothetical protein [Hymenobacter koreensis]|uniref:Uncharacterized protein n=1 Tax=Hymenobacter koreensis TaxID=1084523 RepID=A0ABP8JJN9_9BACT
MSNTTTPTQLRPAARGAGGARQAGQKTNTRRVADKAQVNLEQHWIDYRFVKEVEKIEREGRSQSRVWIERQLGLPAGTCSEIRRGTRGIGAVHIARLKRKFNADHNFILFGVRNNDISLPYIVKGRDKVRVDVFEPYIHMYNAAPNWKIGERPEGDDDMFLPEVSYKTRNTDDEAAPQLEEVEK